MALVQQVRCHEAAMLKVIYEAIILIQCVMCVLWGGIIQKWNDVYFAAAVPDRYMFCVIAKHPTQNLHLC